MSELSGWFSLIMDEVLPPKKIGQVSEHTEVQVAEGGKTLSFVYTVQPIIC